MKFILILYEMILMMMMMMSRITFYNNDNNFIMIILYINNNLFSHNLQVNGNFQADPHQIQQFLDSLTKHKSKILEKVILQRFNELKHVLQKPGLSEKEDEKTEESDNVQELEENSSTINENESTKEVCVENEESKEGNSHDEKPDSLEKRIAVDLQLEHDIVVSILKLYKENLNFSNHISMMDIYEAFINEYFKQNYEFQEILADFNFTEVSLKSPDAYEIEVSIKKEELTMIPAKLLHTFMNIILFDYLLLNIWYLIFQF